MLPSTVNVEGVPVTPIVQAAAWRAEIEEAISYDLVVPTSHRRMDDREEVYIYQEGLFSNVLHVGKQVSEVGFKIAYTSAAIWAGVAEVCVVVPTYVCDRIWGEVNSASAVLRGVRTTMHAAEAIALGTIYASHCITKFSLGATDRALEFGGTYTAATERALAAQVGMMIPQCLVEYADVIAALTAMVVRFLAPLKSLNLTNADISAAVTSYALRQAEEPSRFHPARPRYSVLNGAESVGARSGTTGMPAVPDDLTRCMGFAAASYGIIAMNTLEYVPKGCLVTSTADLLSRLVPGVEEGDILAQHNVEQEDGAAGSAGVDGKTSLHCPGYLLVADHRCKQLVLSVRGSYSLGDIVTDLTCDHHDVPGEVHQHGSHGTAPSSGGSSSSSSAPSAPNFTDTMCDEDNGFFGGPHFYQYQQQHMHNNHHRDQHEDHHHHHLHRKPEAHKGFLLAAFNLDRALRRRVTELFLYGVCSEATEADDEGTGAGSGVAHAEPMPTVKSDAVDGDDSYAIPSGGSKELGYAARGYTLLITGHSLGAGAATLLHLKWRKALPSVIPTRCVVFAPPCTLTLHAAREVGQSPYDVVSVVMGDDVVARLGLSTCLDMRDGCLSTLPQLGQEGADAGATSTGMAHIRSEHMQHRRKLYPAGRILHIVPRADYSARLYTPTSEPSAASATATTTVATSGTDVAYWADQLTFSEIHVSGTMFATHLPPHCLQQLNAFFPP